MENWHHVNLERAMKLGDRLDGHMVQGHVDQVGTCIEAKKLTEAGFTLLNMMLLKQHHH
jgi:riboflavin synthase alpha subunit